MFFLVGSEQQRSQDTPPAASRSRASDSGGDTRHTPPSNADNGPQPPSSKPGWAEEGGSGWGGQGAPSTYQVEMQNSSKKVSPRQATFKSKLTAKDNLCILLSEYLLVGRDVLVCVFVSVDYCGLAWLTDCLYTGAQAWIGWSPGAALPPTWAAPWTRALLLLPTGRHPHRAS